LNNKTGTKRSVWSLSYCSKPKRALNPWFKVSPPPDLTRPIFRMASVVAWQAPHGSKVSAPLRSAQSRHPPDVLQPIFRKALVVAWQAPMGPRSPLCAPSSAWLRLLWDRQVIHIQFKIAY